MTEVVSVRLNNAGKIYYFDPAGLVVKTDDHVIVETAKGQEYAFCVLGNHSVNDEAVVLPLRPVIRIASAEDREQYKINKAKEKDAFAVCQEKIKKHGIDMKLIDVEYNFAGNKILFFFTSEGRVDFRDLVKDLAAVFKTRIELRQIGVRDEAKMLGGLGICGKPFCCTQFLSEFYPVSIKMAKIQGLSLNPAKISGTCGRLMCCLNYEQNSYVELVKKAPKVDAFVETPAGKGSVVSVNLLRGVAKVRLEDQQDMSIKTINFDDLTVLGGKARRQEYIAAKAEGRLEEAGFFPSVIVQPKPEPVREEFKLDEIIFNDDKIDAGPQKPPQKSQKRRRRRSKRPQGQQQGAAHAHTSSPSPESAPQAAAKRSPAPQNKKRKYRGYQGKQPKKPQAGSPEK